VKSLNIGETGSEREIMRYCSNAVLHSERRKRLEVGGGRQNFQMANDKESLEKVEVEVKVKIKAK